MQSTLTEELSALAVASSEVVARRLLGFATTGGSWSARERRETARMASEKFDAFTLSWLSMYRETWKFQLRAWHMTMEIVGMTAGARTKLPHALWPESDAILAAALVPVRRRAQANVRRLRKRKP